MGLKEDVAGAAEAVEKLAKAGAPVHEALLKEKADALAGLCAGLTGIADAEEFDKAVSAISDIAWSMRTLRPIVAGNVAKVAKADLGESAGKALDAAIAKIQSSVKDARERVAKSAGLTEADARALSDVAGWLSGLADSIATVAKAAAECEEEEEGPDGKKKKPAFPGAAPPFTGKADEGEATDVRKPYPNEHAARVREPGDFVEGTFRSKEVADGVRLIMGKLTEGGAMTAQAYRFSKDKFTAAQARKWLADNGVKPTSFEEATAKAEGEPEVSFAAVDPKAPVAPMPRDLNSPEFLEKRDRDEPMFGFDRPPARSA